MSIVVISEDEDNLDYSDNRCGKSGLDRNDDETLDSMLRRVESNVFPVEGEDKYPADKDIGENRTTEPEGGDEFPDVVE